VPRREWHPAGGGSTTRTPSLAAAAKPPQLPAGLRSYGHVDAMKPPQGWSEAAPTHTRQQAAAPGFATAGHALPWRPRGMRSAVPAGLSPTALGNCQCWLQQCRLVPPWHSKGVGLGTSCDAHASLKLFASATQPVPSAAGNRAVADAAGVTNAGQHVARCVERHNRKSPAPVLRPPRICHQLSEPRPPRWRTGCDATGGRHLRQRSAQGRAPADGQSAACSAPGVSPPHTLQQAASFAASSSSACVAAA